MRKRYPSDVTDEQWARIAPIFELARRGRPREVPAREIVNAILYVMKNGCAWRALPHDFPKWQTVFVQRWRWTVQGVLAQALDALRPPEHKPSVGIIDSTFIESAYGGAQCAPNGYKRATGHGVHVLIDKQSRPLAFAVLPGNLQDAAGARALIPDAKRRHSSLGVVLGDKAYRQRPLQSEMAALSVHLDGDSPPLPKGTTFRPMPMRWRIEQFFAWFCKWRRVAKNWCSPRLSRRLNRIVQNFGRAEFNKALTAYSEQYGFAVADVEPAYSSQECNRCHYVDAKNRQASKFVCRSCGHTTHADVNAARNHALRACDASGRSGEQPAGRRNTRVKVLQDLVERFATTKRLADLRRQIAGDPSLLSSKRRHSSPGLCMLSNPYFRTVLAPLRAQFAPVQ